MPWGRRRREGHSRSRGLWRKTWQLGRHGGPDLLLQHKQLQVGGVGGARRKWPRGPFLPPRLQPASQSWGVLSARAGGEEDSPLHLCTHKPGVPAPQKGPHFTQAAALMSLRRALPAWLRPRERREGVRPLPWPPLDPACVHAGC